MSRAVDLWYQPLCKDLKDVEYFPEDEKDMRPLLLARIIDNYIEKENNKSVKERVR